MKEEKIEFSDKSIQAFYPIETETNPVCNGYYKRSEVNNVLQSGYCEPALGNDNVNCFLDKKYN